MSDEEKAREIASKWWQDLITKEHCNSTEEAIERAVLEMARYKDEQLKEVCKRCEQHIIESGKNGCAFRSLGNDYCW